MSRRQIVDETELASLAKEFRLKAGRTKIQAAEDLRVTRTSIQLAEENPEQSLFKLRKRMIEAYSSFRVRGPAYWLEKQ